MHLFHAALVSFAERREIIMIHGHGGSRDWTAGCIAVDNEVMDILFEYCSVGTKITILP